MNFSSSTQSRSTLWSLILLAANFCLAFIASAEDLPDMRPALIGNGPGSLINKIDAQRLMRRGQGSAALLFYCTVLPNGAPGFYRVYSTTENAGLLKFEVREQIARSTFIPAVYNHKQVAANFIGSVFFEVIQGREHLRIFANQDPKEMARESDFISPQPFALPDHHYDYVSYPSAPWASEAVPGIVQLSLTVDASGNLKDARVIKEKPAGKKFGEYALKNIRQSTFLPAFRNGRPVESTTPTTIYYVPGTWRLK